jgi:hypothetical protein
VTLFVNAAYLAEGRAHYFYVLNTMFDRVVPERSRVSWGGSVYDISRPLQRSALRRVLKPYLQGLPDDQARFEALSALCVDLGVTDASVPPMLRTLTLGDVRELIARGVGIQNHGWTHADLTTLSMAAQRDEIVKGREWLEATFDIRADAYAVPFGEPQPEPALRDLLRETWLCANDRWGARELAPGVWNRMSLSLFGASLGASRARAGG